MDLNYTKGLSLLAAMLLFMAAHTCAQGIYDKYVPYYAQKNNPDNIAVFAELADNIHIKDVNSRLMYRGLAATHPIFPRIGIYYKKDWPRMSFHGGVAVMYKPFGYKYASSYDSLTGWGTPALSEKYDNYARYKPGGFMLEPFFDFGYKLHPIKGMYVIEMRVGVSAPIYMGRPPADPVVSVSPIETSSNGAGSVSTAITTYYADNKHIALVNGNVYIGVCWVNTTNPFLNRSALGLQLSFPVWASQAGSSVVDYSNATQGYYIGNMNYKMTITSVGIRYAYDLFQ